MLSARFFAIPEDFSLNEFEEKVADAFSGQQEPKQTVRRTYFDTFDWRLFSRNLTLAESKGKYTLSSLVSPVAVSDLGAGPRQIPAFWQDFPEPAARQHLQELLGVRALLAVARCMHVTESMRILNQDAKTVARLSIDSVEVGNKRPKQKLARLTVQPIRGYAMACAQVVNMLAKSGLSETPDTLLAATLSTSGRKPGKYISKPDLQLTSETPAAVAAQQILENLFSVIQENEAGVLGDIDSEFLHDFRVACRRARSALTQIKGVFTDETTLTLKQHFAYLGQITNRHRDLDVYLLQRKKYEHALAEELRAGLRPLFDSLERMRNNEHQKLRTAMKSKRYREALAAIREFVEVEELAGSAVGANSSLPIQEVAKSTILKRYKKILRDGKRITKESPDQCLHDLRIECKKLRYLLEFFESLFHAEKITVLIRQLKKLQENLGDFNDLTVQQEDLQSHLRKLRPDGKNAIERGAALGGLLSVLHRQQLRTRSEFEEKFSTFRSRSNRDLVAELFK